MNIIINDKIVGNIPEKEEDFTLEHIKNIFESYEYDICFSEYKRKVLHQISKYYNQCSTWRLKIWKQFCKYVDITIYQVYF